VKMTELDDAQQAEAGRVMRNALEHPQFRTFIQRKGMRVFAVAAEDTPFGLALSVGTDNVCRHVVGHANRPPTDAELDIVRTLLAEAGFTLEYDPRSGH